MDYRIPTPYVPEFAPRTYQCRRAKLPFIADGNLDKDFWKDAEWSEAFVDIEGDIKPAPRFETRVKMLWDDNAIYFGAKLSGNEIWGHVTERDEIIFVDNDFEIFIDPDSDTHCYCEFEMNALNTVWDLLLTKPYRDGGFPINSFDIKGLKTAVKIDGELNNHSAANNSWSVEIAIPFTSIIECCGQGKEFPKTGEFWRIDFSRVQWKVDIVNGEYVKRKDESGNVLPEDNWVWSPTGIVNMHYPELWGYVFFCGNSDDNYKIPEDEYFKWELRKLYYKQHAYYDEHGEFTAKIPLDNCKIEPVIKVTNESFDICCQASDKKRMIYIDTYGQIKYK